MPRRAGWLLVLASLAAAAGCGQESSAGSSLAVEQDSEFRSGKVADFRLAEAHGGEISLADLAGKPFVLDFIFTTCPGPCPTLSENMRLLQEQLADTGVRLISVSVDPRLDTVEALRAYAQRLGADPERWKFVRAEADELRRIAQSVALAVGAPGEEATHSTRFVVVDGEGSVRGYYAGDEPSGREAAARRARWLERNPGR